MGDRGPFVSLREDSVTVCRNEEAVLRFDLEGRWFSASLGTINYRRGLDHRVLATPRPTEGSRSGTSRWLPPEETAELSGRVHALALEVLDAGDGGPAGLRDTLAAWDGARYMEQAEVFGRTYGRIPVLPPDRYLTLVVQAARGCPYNRCTFCTLYKDVEFHPLPHAEFEQHLHDVADFLGRGMLMRRGVFLADGNAMALPTAELLDRLESLGGYFRRHTPGPRHPEEVYAFQDTFTDRLRSVTDYRSLRRLGLRRVYLGLESGHEPTRKVLAKPGRAAAAEATIHKLKEAGLSVGVMVLIGAGGRALGPGHVRETAAMIQRLALDPGDRVFLSPLWVAPGSPYEDWLKSMGETPLTSPEMDEQIQRIREAVVHPHGPRVGRYRVEDFVPY